MAKKKKQQPQAKRKAKVAILTNFMEFNPGYSLTGIVKDQVAMLQAYGHDVRLFVNTKYHGEDFPSVQVEKLIPFAHLKDYGSEKKLQDEHRTTARLTAEMLQEELEDVDIVFTHDFVFTGWFLPYGLGVRQVHRHLPKVRWLHWIHSVPSVLRDWWQVSKYGPNHRLVFPNETDKLKVAEQYRGQNEDVRVIPHIKDLRSWHDFHGDTCDFIARYPSVMSADVVQVYPASTDRLTAKQVDKVVGIFAEIKKQERSVCLVIANQWATGTQRQEDVSKFEKIGKREGLVVDQELIFTSKFRPKDANAVDGWDYRNGIPQHMVRELLTCSNLFIFPTREESFGLVLPEAALAGVLCVLNKSLTMQYEVSGHAGLFFDFGSYHQEVNQDKETAKRYLKDIAWIIVGRMGQNESLKAKTFTRQKYNWDNLYNRYYAPVMAESATWE